MEGRITVASESVHGAEVRAVFELVWAASLLGGLTLLDPLDEFLGVGLGDGITCLPVLVEEESAEGPEVAGNLFFGLVLL